MLASDYSPRSPTFTVDMENVLSGLEPKAMLFVITATLQFMLSLKLLLT
jgi:hypothetical protein